MTKAIHVLIMLIFSFFSYADELSSKTQFMIEHPMINFSSLVSLGFQGKVAEVNISGYKLESIGDQKFQFILPKEKLIFSPIGLLEYSSNYSGVELRRSWKFDNEKLLDINEERLNFEGDRESLLTLHYLYDDKGNLSKIESERIFGESLKSDFGCFKFLFSSNVVHARDCALSNRLTHTFNDKYKVESIENSTISNKGSSKKRITIYEYDGEKLKNSKSYLDNELVGSSIYTYHENGAKKTNITKFLSNNIATSITTCTYDNYENETSCIYEKEKPKGHNPIFGDFIAKTETRTMHIQKNDEYGNPLSIESNFYEVFDDKTETLLKREFRTYKYEYYKG